MIQKLRRKLVCVIMAIVTLLLCLIFCTVYQAARLSLEREIVNQMQLAASDAGRTHLPCLILQLGPDGQGHFYGHGKAGAALAQAMLTRRLRLPTQTCQRVVLLVERHDVPLTPTPKAVRRTLAALGPQAASQLAAVHLADLQAHHLTGRNGERLRGFLAETREFAALLEEETRRGVCVSLKDLAVNGADLLKLGYAPGPALGAALNGLLARVVDGSLENRREVLLAAAVDMKRAAAP